MPKLFSFILAVHTYFPGCASSGLDSPEDREARPWHRNSGTEYRHQGKRRDENKSIAVTVQYGTTSCPKSSRGLWTRLALTKQARSLPGSVTSCKTAGLNCVPAGRLESVASAEWDY